MAEDPIGAPAGPTPALNAQSGPAYWTERRLQLAAWLETSAPVLAPLYSAALQMAMDETFPGRVWLVAHAVREIRNRLPDVIAGEIEAARTDYVDLTSAIYEQWTAAGLPTDGSAPALGGSAAPIAGPARADVPVELLVTVSDLLRGHLSVDETNRERAQRLLDAVSGGGAPRYAVDGWVRGTRWANAYMHVRMKPLRVTDEANLLENFLSFESVLLALSARSYENMDDLDEILGRANT